MAMMVEQPFYNYQEEVGYGTFGWAMNVAQSNPYWGADLGGPGQAGMSLELPGIAGLDQQPWDGGFFPAEGPLGVNVQQPVYDGFLWQQPLPEFCYTGCVDPGDLSRVTQATGFPERPADPLEPDNPFEAAAAAAAVPVAAVPVAAVPVDAPAAPVVPVAAVPVAAVPVAPVPAPAVNEEPAAANEKCRQATAEERRVKALQTALKARKHTMLPADYEAEKDKLRAEYKRANQRKNRALKAAREEKSGPA